MKFRKISTDQPVVEHLATLLRRKLDEGQKVLWLIPGGSAIAVAVAVAKNLAGQNLKNLTVTLTDERYGPVGHDDSNWKQLIEAGFNLPSAKLVPVLHGHSVEDTTKEFSDHLQEYCRGAGYCIGLFGMGSDGHTAGILPDSPAAAATNWAVHYQAPNFLRVTMTPPAIAALSEAILYATGDTKMSQLQRLQSEVPLAQQPAQALKKVAKFTIFTDQMGDKS